ncbi:hypothetical protein JCM19992_06110 [Thermostilla marina]
MVEWYYAKDNERFGPVTSAELKRLAEAAQLGPDDLVWREGMSDWVPARRVKGLFPTGTPTAETPQGSQATNLSSPSEAVGAPAEPQAADEVPQFTEVPAAAPEAPDELAKIAEAAESEPIGTHRKQPPRFTQTHAEPAESTAAETSTEAVSSEEAVRFTPTRESARMGAGFERSMSAFTRAREGGGGHLFDALLSGLRDVFGDQFVGGTTWLFGISGRYGLLVACVLVLLFVALAVAAKAGIILVGMGTIAVFFLVLLQYAAGRFQAVLDRWHRSTRVRLGSSALPDTIALGSFLTGLAALIGATVTGIQTGAIPIILVGVVAFIGFSFVGIVALNAEKLGVDIVAESDPTQEALGLGVFFLKCLVIATPVLFGATVLLGCLQLLLAIAVIAGALISSQPETPAPQPTPAARVDAASDGAELSDLEFDENGPILPPELTDSGFDSLGSGMAKLAAHVAFQTAILFLLAGGGIPIATYLLYMIGYLTLSILQAIVILPGLLKQSRGSDRSETAG